MASGSGSSPLRISEPSTVNVASEGDSVQVNEISDPGYPLWKYVNKIGSNGPDGGDAVIESTFCGKQISDGLLDSQTKIIGSPCHLDTNSRSMGYSCPNLPEDMWRHIHSLMLMQDAAKVACVSRAFARSWKCHPNLIFSEESLGLNKNTCRKEDKMKHFISRVDWILKNHAGIGVKKLEIRIGATYNQDCSYLDHLDSWLQLAVKPGIEELIICLPWLNAKYNIPCELLSCATVDSLQYLYLASCNFQPRVRIGCLQSLKKLQLYWVDIADNQLRCLLSNLLALECLELRYCSTVKCLRIPYLRQLSYLEVMTCTQLQVIESKAPNLSSFRFAGDLHVQLALGNALQIKKLNMYSNDAAFYVLTELPSSMPNLEGLIIHSDAEMVSAPMVHSKFCNLKFLGIILGGQNYDYLSLVSFFDACPSLETFILNVLPGRPGCMERPSIFTDPPSSLRMMPEQHHAMLKRVKIINFSSTKSLVELICHIVEAATSLELITLDTTQGWPRCCVNKSGKCFLLRTQELVEARRAILAFQTYIKPKAPPPQWS